MMLLGMVISIFGGLYIWKNIVVILMPYIQDFVENYNISRGQNGNDMVSFFALLIITFLIMIFLLFMIWSIIGDFGIIIIIGLCIYFRFGTDKGKIKD
ncbi:hypothetical protein [Staphylococcus xylosus]|uniref:hypothetical protein n=1 Tax=Staphylococcus xylosus TaxID=1288 RepID=UPI00119F6B8F|nr:hypothetical protein [Staphylococcus xylosus]MCE7786052.1 hypothetical protein [Staphylococcus xylosus]